MFADLMIFVNCFIIADTGIFEAAAKEKVCYKRLMNWAIIRGEIEVAESDCRIPSNWHKGTTKKKHNNCSPKSWSAFYKSRSLT